MKSLTIIEQDRPALLAEIATLLEARQVDVRDITGGLAGDQAVISISAEPYSRCHRILADAGYKVFEAEHLLVRIQDRPGALAGLSQTLANAQVDIRNIHIISRSREQNIVALEVSDPYRAGQILHDVLLREESGPGAMSAEGEENH